MQRAGFPCSYLDDSGKRLDLIDVDEIDGGIQSPCNAHSLALVLLHLLLVIEFVRRSFLKLSA